MLRRKERKLEETKGSGRKDQRPLCLQGRSGGNEIAEGKEASEGKIRRNSEDARSSSDESDSSDVLCQVVRKKQGRKTMKKTDGITQSGQSACALHTPILPCTLKVLRVCMWQEWEATVLRGRR